jgi:UPF0755 protein
MMSEHQDYESMRPEPRWPRLFKAVAVVVLIVGAFAASYFGVKALAGWVGDAIGAGETPTSAPGLTVTVEIPTGATGAEIATLLADAGVVESAPLFERELESRRVAGLLQAGTYELETGMDTDALIEELVAGPEGQGVFRITIIEGLTIEQMLESISDQTGFAIEELTEPLLDGTVQSKFLPEGDPVALPMWEGLLFPDTYEIAESAPPATVLQLLAETAESRIDSVDWTMLTEMGYTAYDGVIIASMIEREAKLDDERPIIAGVIMNRLDQGLPLQIDATVVYALGGSAPQGLTLEDLEIDSPYNTYLRFGLPPTPIAGPRLASLRAAAAPTASDYLYYVLIDADGSHAFTGDFDEFLDLQQQARESGLIP